MDIPDRHFAGQPYRNIHAVAENVMRLDDYIADIDPNTESNPSVLCIRGCKLFSAGLKLRGSSKAAPVQFYAAAGRG